MRKKALKKEFRVEIRRSLNRFLSILFIVALGVMVFAGVHASAPDMRASGDFYFDQGNLMDLRVIGTLGITEEDLQAMEAVEGIEAVYGTYMEDVYCQEADSQEVLHIEAIREGVNELTPAVGRLPEKADECFLDSEYALKYGYEVGDTLEIQVESEEDSTLLCRSYTISGYGYSPCYISFSRGSTTLGTGTLSGFVYVLPEAFDSEVYSVAYLHVTGAKEQMEFTDGYEEQIEKALEQVESIADVRCEIRYSEIMDEAQSELNEAKQEVEDGKQELEDARAELEEGKAEAQSELNEAQSELADGQQQLEDGRQELEDARAELASGQQEIEDGEQELAQNAKSLEDAQAQLATARSELQSGESEYQSGLKQFQDSKSDAEVKLSAAQQQVTAGKEQLTAGWTDYQTNLAAIESGETQLAAAETQLKAAQSSIAGQKSQLAALKTAQEANAAQLAQKKSELEADETQLAQQKTQYEQERAALDAAWVSYKTEKQNTEEGLAQAAAAEQTVQNLQLAYQVAEADVAAKETAVQSSEQKITELNEAITALTQEKTALEQQKAEAVVKNDLTEAERLLEAIAQKEQKISEQNQLLTVAQNELTQSQSNLAAAKTDCAQKKTAYESEAQKLSEQKSQLQAQAAQLAEQEKQLNAQESSLSVKKQQQDSDAVDLAARRTELESEETKLAAETKEREAGEIQLAAAEQELTDNWTAWNTQKQELQAGRTALEQAKIQLEASQSELDAAQAEIDAGYSELEKSQKQLEAARKELDLGWAQLNASKKQLSDGQRQLNAGRSQLSEARASLQDGLAQIQEAEQELAENEVKLKDGWEEYEDGKKESEEKLAEGEQKIRDAEEDLLDAEQKIQEAEEDLAEIKFQKWYVNDRSVLQEHTGFGENADRLTNIAQVFPLLFFLVAALISLTTMTRMVEEERTQIGTLKALGYSKKDIAGKYLKYAFWATVGGSLLGILIGEKFLPWVIIEAYGIMYVYLPKIVMPYHWDFGLSATAIALICTIGATLSSCYRALQTVPAQLMRPPAPKVGKKILLEHLPFLWKHLSFSWKSAVRNLMRYKKRCLMTMIGIGGCMGLLLVGYGLRDSIMDIAALQFADLQTYDVMVVLDPDEETAQAEFLKMTQQDTRISAQKRFYMQSQTIQQKEQNSGKEWSVYLYVPEDTAALSEFLTFRDRESKEIYELTDEGAIITEKVATKLGIEPGDSVTLEKEDGENVEIPIAAVCENYLSHYLYLTPALYEQVYGEEPEYNSLFLKSEESQEVLEEIGASLLENDAVLNITYTRTMADQVEDMLVALDSVMIVFIGAAGALAFVVLYNLNNININERRRELATLKVLGFFDGEVGAYVYRENIVLTIAGTLLGCLIGKVLHMFIILTVEVDSCMFGRQIKPMSFVIGTLFTFAFSLIVNWVMYFKLKKIDMVESLKSIE